MDQIDRVKPAPPTPPTAGVTPKACHHCVIITPPIVEPRTASPKGDKKEVKADSELTLFDHDTNYRDKYIQAKRQLNACQQKLREATQAVAELTTSNDKLNEQLTEAMTSSDMYEGMYEDLELLRERMDVIKLSEYLYNQDTSVIAKQLGMTYADYTEKYNKVRAIRNQLCHPTPQDYTTAEVLEMMDAVG
jgi:chromosome segregation ATPase